MLCLKNCMLFFFFFQAEDGIRDHCVTGVQTCALPISGHAEPGRDGGHLPAARGPARPLLLQAAHRLPCRSEEHTSELQSHSDLVCRLLLEKKKKKTKSKRDHIQQTTT